LEINIRKFQEQDITHKVKWINDNDNNKYLHYDLPLEEKKTLSWFKSLTKRKNRLDCTIICNNKPIGLIGLINIDSIKKTAEYYICIGEKDFKGKGVATIATDILVKKSYRELHLSRIYLYTEVKNLQAWRFFEKFGFTKECLLKNNLIYNGRKIDRCLYWLDLDNYINKK
jgi:diamine N-acetyltransferase